MNEGRVAVVTGAGGGIGRGYALALAADGASVVVNDVGVSRAGEGDLAAEGAADKVVREIREAGGQAIADTGDISTDAGASQLIARAIEEFGGLDILVNNAGIVRDRMLVSMSEQDFDDVVRVHLKGTFGPLHHAGSYWRDRSKAGAEVDARIINTTSASGLFGNVGQGNYGAAKAAIASMTIIASQEMARYGVTVNAIAPRALTRMTEDIQAFQTLREAPGGEAALAPEGIAPLVVWLASPASRHVTGRVFGASGGRIAIFDGWAAGPSTEDPAGWAAPEVGAIVDELLARARPNAGPDGSVRKG
jgi:NAD(P)-dependent dehydrogenase (short-subunit alcohol dehydrogenase family)